MGVEAHGTWNMTHFDQIIVLSKEENDIKLSVHFKCKKYQTYPQNSSIIKRWHEHLLHKFWARNISLDFLAPMDQPLLPQYNFDTPHSHYTINNHLQKQFLTTRTFSVRKKKKKNRGMSPDLTHWTPFNLKRCFISLPLYHAYSRKHVLLQSTITVANGDRKCRQPFVGLHLSAFVCLSKKTRLQRCFRDFGGTWKNIKGTQRT